METDKPQHYKWTIDAGATKQRLDQFLALQKVAESRSQIQRLVAKGMFLVNGKIVGKDYPLTEGDVVESNSSVVQEYAEQLQEKRSPVEVPVLYEDDAILVINKPIGVLVHPTPQSDEWTIADFVRSHCGDAITHVGDDPTRPGIIHRLDRDVSGVMVIAKTAAAFATLKEQFMGRTITKEYRAIVFGTFPKDAGTITFKITHSKTRGGKMAAKPEHEEGREAWTDYDVLQKFKRFSLLQVRIRTGRTHQIRAHLAAIDHPVVGDMVYGAKRTRGTKGIARVYLHAFQLEITHPVTGERKAFTAPIPAEFDAFINA